LFQEQCFNNMPAQRQAWLSWYRREGRALFYESRLSPCAAHDECAKEVHGKNIDQSGGLAVHADVNLLVCCMQAAHDGHIHYYLPLPELWKVLRVQRTA
jgi:hypothetical protein